MTQTLTRRRFIHISAATAGLGALSVGGPIRAEVAPVIWRGTMLGAVATMEIHDENRSRAERLIALACAEARRLERQFSLYMKDSALAELNRTGILVGPAPKWSNCWRHRSATRR